MDIERTGQDEVLVKLTYDEALVLSDALGRWFLAGPEHQSAIPLVDPAEVRAFDSLHGSFDPVIDEMFPKDYGRIIDEARSRIAAGWSDE